MKPSPLLLIIILLFLITTTTFSISPSLPPTPTPTPKPSPTPSPSSSPSTLDPNQLKALQSLNIHTSKDPCSLSNATTCDSSKPFRRLTSLRLSNCPNHLHLSFPALKSLSTLKSLSFINCPISLTRFPPELASSLRSFTAVKSLRRISGVSLSRLANLTDLTVTNVQVQASGPYVILGHMSKLKTLTISHANLTGFLPRHLRSSLTHIDFSGNKLRGNIPTSITMLDTLESLNLSSNSLKGVIPSSIGDLISLKSLSLASNSFSGPIPDSISAIPGLVQLDLSSNQFNGTIPKFISQMKNLKYLNLANNNLRGVLPFNSSFINRLVMLKVNENSNLCYNQSVLSSNLKLGIARCDKYGMPMSPPPVKGSSADDVSDDDYDESDDGNKKGRNRGPNKVVLGVAIALSSLVFIVVFLVLCLKCCR